MLKTIGIILIFFCFAAFGFLKSNNLSKRKKQLEFYLLGVSLFCEHIMGDRREISKILPVCFGNKVFFEGREIKFNTEALAKSDISVLKEFFDGIGTLPSRAEAKRTSLYKERIARNLSDAEKDMSLCRLYRSLGLLSGLGICIFLI